MLTCPTLNAEYFLRKTNPSKTTIYYFKQKNWSKARTLRSPDRYSQ